MQLSPGLRGGAIRLGKERDTENCVIGARSIYGMYVMNRVKDRVHRAVQEGREKIYLEGKPVRNHGPLDSLQVKGEKKEWQGG